MAPRTYRFGEFELDERLFELRRGGVRVELQPKTVDLLLHLVRNRDRIVPKDELFNQLWRETAVSDASLAKAVSAARRAIGDDGGAQSCIETVRGRGFRFVAAVEDGERATGVSPRAAADAPESDFVGRREILDAIADAFADAGRGAGRLLLLTGEAGMGKTRTAQEGAARCRAQGAHVVSTWCTESEGMPSLWPWLHLLRQLADDCERGPLKDDLAETVAALSGRGTDLPAPSSVDPEQARFHLFDTITAILKRAAERQPRLFVLDDVHWADRSSLELLDFLSRQMFDSRLAVVAGYREEDLAPGHPLREITRRPGCRTLALRGLDSAEVARLVEAELGAGASPGFVEAIHRRTEGNPFFVKELARALAARGPTDGASSVAGLSPLPAGIREVLRQRLDRLSPPCVEILRIAAVMGRDFDAVAVAEVAGVAPSEVLQRCDEAEAARLVRRETGGEAHPAPSASASRSFAHALVRDVLWEDIPVVRRAGFHRRIAETLEARHRDDLDAHVAELAHHFCAGVLGEDADRAIEYARRAGDRAVRLLAFDEAATHYRRALELQGSHGGADARLRCELLLALGEAEMTVGRAREGRALLQEAAGLARRLGAAELLGRAALASGGLEFSTDPGIHDPDLIRLLEESLAGLPKDDSTLRVRLLARLAMALCWVPALERSAELIEEAVATARRLGEPAAVAHALYIHRWSLIGHADLEAQLADSDEMLAHAGRAGARVLELAARSCRFLDLMELGRMGEADRELAAYERLGAQLRVPRYRWRARFYRAMRVQLEGRFAEAEKMMQEALDEGQRLQIDDAISVFGVQLLLLRLEQGRIGEMEAALHSFVDRSPAVPAWRSSLPLLHAELGRLAEARDSFETFAVDEFRRPPRDVFWLPAMVFLAEACCLLDDGPRAAKLYHLLRPFAPRTVLIGVGVACWGALDRFLGSLALTAGDYDAAQRHLEVALRMNTRIGARPWVGWTHYDCARLTSRRSKGDDLEQARAHLVSASEIAQSLGMARLAGRVAGAVSRAE